MCAMYAEIFDKVDDRVFAFGWVGTGFTSMRGEDEIWDEEVLKAKKIDDTSLNCKVALNCVF